MAAHAGRIDHPRQNETVPHSFLALGSCPRDVFDVVGCLVDDDGKIICYGKPMFVLPSERWVLHFRKVKQHAGTLSCTLEVFGHTLHRHTMTEKLEQIDSPQRIQVRGPTHDASISWPASGTTGLAACSFTPYGDYGSTGTLRVHLSEDNGSFSADASSVTPDPSDGTWSAGFDAFTPSTNTYTLTLYLNEVLQDTKTQLGFTAC